MEELFLAGRILQNPNEPQLDKGKRKDKAKEDPNAPKKYTVQQLRALKEVSWEGTRFPDFDFFQEMGIREDVEAILENMGLRRFVSQVHDTYVDLVVDFFSTLKVDINEPERDECDQTLMLVFKCKGVEYVVKADDFTRSYGLKMGTKHQLAVSSSSQEDLWNFIGNDKYKGGNTKASMIRHPALRYVHKTLANTFLLRRESGALLSKDLGYLMVGLKPFLTQFLEGRRFFANNNNVSMAAIFTQSLLEIRTSIIEGGKTKVAIGGLLTPMFKDLGIELTGKRVKHTMLDKEYCQKFGFISGRCNGMIAYKYEDQLLKRVLLPRPELTSIQVEENIAFKLTEADWYDRRKHGRVWRNKGKEVSNEEEEEDEDEEEHVYGSARYDFVPYDGDIRQPALKKAHEHIHLLQRLNKWQGRTIRKMAMQLKSLTKEVKSLKTKFGGAGCSTSRHDDVVEPTMDVGMDVESQTEGHGEEDPSVRHSFHGVETEREDAQEQPRASSYEKRQRRKRRATRSPTPIPASSNESYSFGSDTWY